MKKIITVLKQYKGQSIMLCILTILLALLQVCIAYIHTYSFNALIQQNFTSFFQIESIILLLWIMLLGSNYFVTVYKTQLINKIIYELRQKYIQQQVEKTYMEYAKKKPIDYANALNNDLNTIQQQGFDSFFSLIEKSSLLLFSLFALINIHYSLAILALLLTYIITYIPKLFTKKIQNITETKVLAQNSFLEKTLDVLEGFNILFSAHKYELISKIINKNSDELQNELNIYTKKYEGMMVWINLTSICSQFIVVFWNVVLMSLNLVSIGTIQTVGNVSANVFNALPAISQYRLNIQSISNLLERYLNIEKDTCSSIQVPQTFEKLVLNDVSINFDSRNIFDKFSYTFKKHGKYAIVGKSGSGKSTLLNAMLGRLVPNEGDIYLNGQEVQTIQKNISNCIGYVSTDKHLFKDSLLENITLYSEVNETKLKEVLELCQLEHLNLKEPIDTLSQGEIQRVMLARTLLLDQELIFMDEITANLDSDNALRLEKYLLNQPNKTLVIITHHLRPEIKELYDDIIQLTPNLI